MRHLGCNDNFLALIMHHQKAVIIFYQHVLIRAEGDKLIAADLGRETECEDEQHYKQINMEKKILDYFKRGPATRMSPLTSKIAPPPLRKPPKRPVGRPRKRPLESDDSEVPLQIPLSDEPGSLVQQWLLTNYTKICV